MPEQKEEIETKNTPTRVLVIGAGPGGLLATINLLRRNTSEYTQYHVTLVDPGVDYGALDEDGLSKHRSWMIGLSSHGLSAVQEIPGLYEDYVKILGIEIKHATIGVSSGLKHTFEMKEGDSAGFCVDRNYICGALARYLKDNFGEDTQFISHYNTRALFVDGENRKVMVRSNDNPNEMMSLDYDIVLGCDGIRSVVRNAFIMHHREFEFDIQGIFIVGKSTHLTLPKGLEEGHFMFLLNSLPNILSFVLPERGQKLNANFGWNLNTKVDDALYSDDPAIVEAYAKKHFKYFDMDCAEFAKQWTNQSLQTTQMVHCNFYHSDKLRALLLGDAAHATSPNIGQGMNTALADAAVLNRLLNEHEDSWDKVLPAFSKERVKEGNALTELSFNTFCIDSGMMISITVRQNMHRALNRILPTWLLEPEPINELSKGMKLSVAYDKMVRYGYMAKSRQMNQDIKQAYFEKQVGMVQERESSWLKSKVVMAAVVAAVGYCLSMIMDNRSVV